MVSHLEFLAGRYSNRVGRSFLGTENSWTYYPGTLKGKCHRILDVGRTGEVKGCNSSPFTVQREFWKDIPPRKREGELSTCPGYTNPSPGKVEQQRREALPNSLYTASIIQHQNQRRDKKENSPTRTQKKKSSTRQEQPQNPTMCEKIHHEPVAFTLGVVGQFNKPPSHQ